MSLYARNYRELIVWQKSMDLVVAVYHLTNLFPSEEKFGLVSQMRRCAVSIPSNIAEGSKKTTDKHFYLMLCDAYASGAELETQIDLSKRLFSSLPLDFSRVDSLLSEVMKMMNKMTFQLRSKV